MLLQLEAANGEQCGVNSSVTREHKSALGQFMTPPSVARFMAGLFPSSSSPICRLLDAGAGLGALSCAFLDRWLSGDLGLKAVEMTAYEIDPALCRHLQQRLASYGQVQAEVIAGDYIELATLANEKSQGFTHAILNPPYKKIGSRSPHRLALRSAGIETVNLYSAFVALAVAQAAPGGQIVAIIPRSFCNGPYYRPFRDFILERAAIRHIHLFDSRNQAFKDDNVLQGRSQVRSATPHGSDYEGVGSVCVDGLSRASSAYKGQLPPSEMRGRPLSSAAM